MAALAFVKVNKVDVNIVGISAMISNNFGRGCMKSSLSRWRNGRHMVVVLNGSNMVGSAMSGSHKWKSLRRT